MSRKEKIETAPYKSVGEYERRLLCPECRKSRLPFDSYTECDNCGAHLEIYVEVKNPMIENEQ